MKNLLSRLKKYLHKKEVQDEIEPLRVEIFMRHCYYSDASNHKKRPSYFDRKAFFENFLSTINHDFVRVTCILDTFHEGDQPHFVLEQDQVEVICISEGKEAKSFTKLLEIVEAKKLSPETILYFVEDDYIHRQNWIDVMLEGFSIPNIDYVTLYDHPDKYTDLYQNLQTKLYTTKSAHWRETPSTTNTYAMRAKTLKKHLRIHQEFSEGVAITKDHSKFCALSAVGAKLISCIPGYSTHVELGFESPCIDWEKILLNTQLKMSS